MLCFTPNPLIGALPQGDVQKLKGQMGKVAKSVLVEAASQIDQNAFWSLKMKAYIQDLPAHLASEGAMGEAFSELDGLDELSEEAFKKTTDLLGKLPEWREVLRAPNLKEIQEKIQLKLAEMTVQTAWPLAIINGMQFCRRSWQKLALCSPSARTSMSFSPR